MKILFITHYSRMMGANASMCDLLKGLKQKGIQCYVVCPEKGDLTNVLDKLEIEYIIIHHKCSFVNLDQSVLMKRAKTLVKESYNKIAVKRIVSYAKLKKIDIIHSNSFAINIGARAAITMNLPHIWHLREFLEDFYNLTNLNTAIQKKCLEYTQEYITISNAVSEYFKDTLPSTKLNIIYDGIKEPNYGLLDVPLPNRTRNINVFVIVGSVTESKGVLDALSAFSNIVSQGYVDNELWIIGTGNEKILKVIKNIIYSDGLVEKVRMFGYQKNVKPFLERADFGLMCSKFEALGRVTVEYMRNDVVVIGNNAGGTKEILDYGNVGVLYEPENVEDLADKMIYGIKNKDLLTRMSKKAKFRAEYEFSVERSVNKVAVIYDNII